MSTLNLGAGNRIIHSGVNHDLRAHRPEIDIAHDLNRVPWPWMDESFDAVVAWAVLEHLSLTLVEAMDEIWRITLPGGIVEVKLPYWNHEESYNDPSHRYVAGLKIFDTFDPDTDRGNPDRFGFYTPYKRKILTADFTGLNQASLYFKLEKRDARIGN